MANTTEPSTFNKVVIGTKLEVAQRENIPHRIYGQEESVADNENEETDFIKSQKSNLKYYAMLKKDNESKHFLENNPQIISQEAYNYLKDWTTVVHYLGAKVYYEYWKKTSTKNLSNDEDSY